MKKKFIIIAILSAVTTIVCSAQTDSVQGSFTKASPRSYQVHQAFEVESLVPMFFTGGYHFAVCYRYEKFRVRLSVINGGNYDAETAGLNNSSHDFERHYKTSPGLFLGYNIWRNLEAYTYLELHTFEIEQKNTGITKDIHSTDTGVGISYQFFVGSSLYIQPGFHIYLRGDHSTDFPDQTYNISNIDLSPVLRIGYRLWKK